MMMMMMMMRNGVCLCAWFTSIYLLETKGVHQLAAKMQKLKAMLNAMTSKY